MRPAERHPGRDRALRRARRPARSVHPRLPRRRRVGGDGGGVGDRGGCLRLGQRRRRFRDVVENVVELRQSRLRRARGDAREDVPPPRRPGRPPRETRRRRRRRRRARRARRGRGRGRRRRRARGGGGVALEPPPRPPRPAPAPARPRTASASAFGVGVGRGAECVADDRPPTEGDGASRGDALYRRPAACVVGRVPVPNDALEMSVSRFLQLATTPGPGGGAPGLATTFTERALYFATSNRGDVSHRGRDRAAGDSPPERGPRARGVRREGGRRRRRGDLGGGGEGGADRGGCGVRARGGVPREAARRAKCGSRAAARGEISEEKRPARQRQRRELRVVRRERRDDGAADAPTPQQPTTTTTPPPASASVEKEADAAADAAAVDPTRAGCCRSPRPTSAWTSPRPSPRGRRTP